MQELKAAISSARQLHRSGGGSVLDLLLRSVQLSLVQLADELERYAGVEVMMEPARVEPDFSLVKPNEAQAISCVPLRGDSHLGVAVAMADPWDDAAVRRVTEILGTVPRRVAAPSVWMNRWLPGAVAATQTSGASIQVDAAAGPVVDFVDAAIRAAFDGGASDIHFECDRAGVTVKLRQDGVMVRFARLDDLQRAEEVISRIKVLAQLDITERRTPQDGRFRFALKALSVDLRVSIMPSVFGEDAVLRLLDKAQLRSRSEVASLGLLGFDEGSTRRIRDLAELPHGMLLVTGPTGSGKTTTVYAALSEINTGLEKIITIEDPVEYELPGVLQIPVNERKGLTFAKGLRSILRHDPDRILVGEIRDAETAEIAVQSALTGHQVFTTVHANSLFDVVGRFRHFRLDIFGFMSSLNGVVVQRLVRQVCDSCVGARPATADELTWLSGLGLSTNILPLAQGCPLCHGTGYRGRSVLAEVHAIDDGLRDLVVGGSAISVLRAYVDQSDVPSLGRMAAAMVLAGRTTTAEVKRVVGWQVGH